jgi:hypothetical protein
MLVQVDTEEDILQTQITKQDHHCQQDLIPMGMELVEIQDILA